MLKYCTNKNDEIQCKTNKIVTLLCRRNKRDFEVIFTIATGEKFIRQFAKGSTSRSDSRQVRHSIQEADDSGCLTRLSEGYTKVIQQKYRGSSIGDAMRLFVYVSNFKSLQ